MLVGQHGLSGAEVTILADTGMLESLGLTLATVAKALSKLHQTHLGLGHPQYYWLPMKDIVDNLTAVLEAGGDKTLRPTLAVAEAIAWPMLVAEFNRLVNANNHTLLSIVGTPRNDHVKSLGQQYTAHFWLWHAISVAWAAM